MVEDCMIDYLIIAYSLKGAADIVWCRTVKEAIGLLDVTYDCILLDYRLPDGSGLDIVRVARRRGVTTPIIMTSSLDTTRAIVVNDVQAFIDKDAIVIRPGIVPETINEVIRS